MHPDPTLAARFKTYLRALLIGDRKTLDALGSHPLKGKAPLEVPPCGWRSGEVAFFLP